MRNGPKRETGWPAALVAAGLILWVGQAGASGAGKAGSVAGRQSERRTVIEPGPAARAVEPLLARLWASGFFRRNEAVRSEILNNSYAFFEGGTAPGPGGWKGCYSRRPDGAQVISLRKDLFARFEIGLDGIAEHARLADAVLPVLVHEICHDLWANILDRRERAAFCRESDELMEEYRRALTDEDRRRFLRLAGDEAEDPLRLGSYAGIDGFLATGPPRALCGQELFAWLAERLFATKAMIPGPLRKYYACVIAGIPPGATESRK